MKNKVEKWKDSASFITAGIATIFSLMGEPFGEDDTFSKYLLCFIYENKICIYIVLFIILIILTISSYVNDNDRKRLLVELFKDFIDRYFGGNFEKYRINVYRYKRHKLTFYCGIGQPVNTDKEFVVKNEKEDRNNIIAECWFSQTTKLVYTDDISNLNLSGKKSQSQINKYCKDIFTNKNLITNLVKRSNSLFVTPIIVDSSELWGVLYIDALEIEGKRLFENDRLEYLSKTVTQIICNI